MTMPPWSDDPEASRPYFRRLRELAERHGLAELSMGMSHDLEAAIEEGATCVRVGTALFGERRRRERGPEETFSSAAHIAGRIGAGEVYAGLAGRMPAPRPESVAVR